MTEPMQPNDANSIPADQSSSRDAKTTGFSGPKFTISLILVLLVTGGLLVYTLWVYNQIDLVRESSDQAWRQVAIDLDERYRKLEETVAAISNAEQAAPEVAGQFRNLVDRFSTTALPTTQAAAAAELEQFLETHPDLLAAREPSAEPLANDSTGTPTSPFTTPELERSIEQFNQVTARKAELLRSLGGQMLQIFVYFAPPQPLQLADIQASSITSDSPSELAEQ